VKTGAKVKKWGNSLAIRVPQRVAEDLGLSDNTDIEIKSNGKTMTITASPKQKMTLAELLEGITPENVHPATDWGPDVGKERWYDE
jgi:antitoxin MazE